MNKGPSSSPRRWLMLLLKLAVSTACISYVSTKIDFSAAATVLRSVNPYWLLAALAGYTGSKLLAAWRLNYYFTDIGLQLPPRTNIALYCQGMFYNLFLPGAISGDAWKVIQLHKKYKTGLKITSAAVLIDRFSGLLGLGIVLSVIAFFVPELPAGPWLYGAGAAGAVLIAWLLIRYYFPVFRHRFWQTLIAGLLVQLIQLLVVFFIWKSVAAPGPLRLYLLLFLLSSVAAVIPVAAGGIGLREIVFLKGAVFLGAGRETAVLIGFIFYLVTVAGSLPGMWYLFSNPLNDKGPP